MPIIMFSTFFAPTSNAPAWFDTIATINPFTQVLDGTRDVLDGNTEATNLLVGLVGFVIIGVTTYSLAARAYAGVITPD